LFGLIYHCAYSPDYSSYILVPHSTTMILQLRFSIKRYTALLAIIATRRSHHECNYFHS